MTHSYAREFIGFVSEHSQNCADNLNINPTLEKGADKERHKPMFIARETG